MPLKKDKKNTENKKDEKIKLKKEAVIKKSTKKTKEIKENLSKKTKICCVKNRNYKIWFEIIVLILLLTNLIVIIMLIYKINQINKWTLLYNWGIENYNNLKSVYDSPEYKEYILNEINDLKKQLNDKEIVQK